MSRSRRWDVLGIGDAGVDIFLRVERLPGRDEKIMGECLGEYPGGVVANFCCAASRLGSRTALATVVGDDLYGRMAIADLEAHEVDTGSVTIRQGGRTYFCVVNLDGSGEKALTVVKTDCMLPGRSDVDPGAFAHARLVHLTSSDPSLAAWVASEAKTRNTIVSLDLEPAGAGAGLQALHELLENVDLVFANEAGLSTLVGDDLLAGARKVLHFGPRAVVVTMGSKGSLIVTRDNPAYVPAFRVAVVDTTGAGDCFNAAFVTGYLEGWSLVRCGRFATAAAAISVTRVGGRGALPSYGEVEEFLPEWSEGRLSRGGGH